MLLIFVPSVQLTGASVDGSNWWNAEYNTTEGKDFWVTFMRNSGSSGQDNQDMSLYVYATARQDAIVTITNPRIPDSPLTFNVRANKQDSCLIPNSWAYLEAPQIVNNFGINVKSNVPISLYATNQHSSGKYDATNILPTTALSGEYVVQTYHIDQYATEFAIVATESQDVRIEIHKTTIDIDDYNLNGKLTVLSTADETIERSMQAGQTYLYRSATEDLGGSSNRATSLAGTKICSSKPLALFVGGQSAKIPFVDPENHIFSQVYPIDKWGKTFIITPTYGIVYDYVLFTACKNNTQIKRNGITIATINAFESYQDTIESIVSYSSAMDVILGKEPSFTPSAVVYSTSQIAECFLYATGYNANHPLVEDVASESFVTKYGAPVLTPIVPQELAMRKNIFATFTKTNTHLKHYVNLVTPTSEVGTMFIDGTNIASYFHPIDGNDAWSFAIKEVSGVAHTIENRGTNQNSTFTARVYGLGNSSSSRESYAYAAGSRTNRSVDLLIEDRYRKTLDTCINEDPVKFSAVINFEYDSIGWQSKLSGDYSKSGHNDSIFHYDYHEAGTDSLRLIVKSHTALCNTIYHYDTIWALIHVHDTAHYDMHYGDTTFMTLCFGEDFSVRYKEGDNLSVNHTFKADTTTTQNFLGKDQRFKLNTLYLVKDSFKTTWGCDSVVWQRFIIRPTYERIIYDTICVSDLPYAWKDKDDNLIRNLDLSSSDKAALRLTDKNAYITKKKTDSYNHKSIYRCDSIINIELTILPIYKLTDSATVCVDSINPYIWAGHPMTHVYNSAGEKVSSISLKQSGDYTYIDSLKTHGCKACELAKSCDSIWILHLKVLDRHVKDTKSSMCSNESYLWEDTLWIGWNAETPAIEKYKRVFSTDTVLYHAYKTKDIYECDSVIIHRLHICDAYTIVTDTTRVDICEDESYYFASKGETYQWSTPDGVVSRFVLTDTIKTVNSCDGTQHCDSAIAHVVYVHPEYH